MLEALAFAGTLLVVLAAIHWYLWFRLVRGPLPVGRPRRLLGGLLVALLALPVIAMVGDRSWPPAVVRPLQWVGFVWIGLMLYLFVVLLVLELPRLVVRLRSRRRGGVDPGRRLLLSRVLAGTALLVAGGTSVVGAVTALGPVGTKRVQVRLAKLDPALSGYTIAVLGDIHLSGLVGAGTLARHVETVNAAAPDVVAIVGDLVDGSVDDLGPAACELTGLTAPDGVFFVTGNHEYYSGAAEWVEFLAGIGVRVLRNERVELSRGSAAFDLAGTDDISAADSGVAGHGANLSAALAGRDTSRPVVLLAHQPVFVDESTAAGVDLQISAHTHGGQVWPFHYVVLLAQPVLAGLSRIRGTWLYVSRGTGFAGPPMRVGAPPEITLIELVTG